ncbi:protein rolling stone [Drosophila madeirensis]
MVKNSTKIKALWVCYWINMIALVYWTCIHTYVYPLNRDPTSPTYFTDLYKVWTHAMPPIFFHFDHLIVAQPTRLLHFLYPLEFVWIYTGFTLVYYVMGGLDLKGRRYTYNVLNYTNPREALLTIGLISASSVFVSTLQYVVYRFRTFLARSVIPELIFASTTNS